MSNLFPMLRSSSLFPEDRLLKSFYDSFNDTFREMTPSMAIDLKDEGDHYLLEADMPGFAKENIKLNYKDNILTINASTQEEKTEENKEKKFMMRERHSASVRRQLMIRDVREEEIQATMENGVLRVTLPKKNETALPQGKDIEIK